MQRPDADPRLPNEELKAAMRMKNEADVCAFAEEALRSGASALRQPEPDGFDPLYDALSSRNSQLVEILIKNIIKESQVMRGDKLDAKATKNALAKNLWYRQEKNRKPDVPGLTLGMTPLELATVNNTEGMLPMVWKYFKGHVDIDQPFANRRRAAHWAAILSRKNLNYLVSEGAKLDVTDQFGCTPLMASYGQVLLIPSISDANEILNIFEAQNIDFQAVDKEGRGLAYYLIHDASRFNVHQPAFSWYFKAALKKNINFDLPDKDRKTPLDYFMEGANKPSFEKVENIFHRLSKEGYNIDRLLRKYTGPEVEKLKATISRWQKRLAIELQDPDLLQKLWHTNGTPTGLLLQVFGVGIPEKIFENKALRDDPAAAKALYLKMKEKLPPQCQHALQYDIDTAAFMRASSPKAPSSASASVLKRRQEASDRSPEGGRR